jgi:MFS family permease
MQPPDAKDVFRSIDHPDGDPWCDPMVLSASPLKARFSRTHEIAARHRDKKLTLERTGSAQSRRALDWTNFFLADVQTGFGAFVAFYLAGLSWSQVDVGLVLTIGRLTSALMLVPGGILADEVRWKRALAAAGIATLACAALLLALRPSFVFVVIAEILHGMTAGIIGPAIAAISLGIAGQRAMSCRTGRNQRFRAAGNALTAVLLGLFGAYIAKSTMFLATAALTVPALAALSFVRNSEIDYARARNAGKDAEAPGLRNILELGKNSQLLWFSVCLAIFQFADASMLTLASEQIGYARSAEGSLIMSGLVVVPQLIVAILAPWIGYFSELWGRKPLLLIGFGVEIIRATFFAFTTNPISLIFVQILDGFTGATLTVLTVVIVMDLTTGTGRFNLASGAVGLVATIGAALSTAASGFIAQEAGHWAGFLSMAAEAAMGTLLVWLVLTETKPKDYVS